MNMFLWFSLAVVAVVVVSVQANSPPFDANWMSIDISSDGQNLLAVSADEGVHVSNDGGINWQKALIGCDAFSKGVVSGNGTDYGQTWTAVDLPSDFVGSAVEISESGQYQVAVSFVPSMVGQIHFSTDYGYTWNIGEGSVYSLGSLAMSSIGDHIYIGPVAGSFIHSDDFGKSFDRSLFSTYQGGVLTCDAQCEHMAYSNFNCLFLSNNNGTDFKKADLPQGGFTDAVFSADGKYVYAAMAADGIYFSADYGVSWEKTSADSGFFVSITTDSTGRIVAGALNNGTIVISQDYGKTWF